MVRGTSLARPGPAARRRLGAALLLVTASALAGCQSSSPYLPKGPCQPTCAGRDGGGYAAFDEAHKAFTRSTKDGVLTATLEDVAWLRFEGSEDELVKKHRAYFEQGYTTFNVVLRTKDFTQPTAETFVLEDSRGARLTGKPVTYQAGMGMEQERFANRFSISFRHAITSDLAWVRLTRAADGGTLEWVFDAAAPAAGGSAPVAPQPAGRVVKGTPLSSYRESAAPVEPAPPTGPVDGAAEACAPPRVPSTSYADLPPATGGRPVNLLRVPAPSAPAPAYAPPAGAPPAYPAPAAAPAPAPARPASDPNLPPTGPLPPPSIRPVR